MQLNFHNDENLSKDSSPQKTKDQNESAEDLPLNKYYNIENTITAMLDKVMEENETD